MEPIWLLQKCEPHPSHTVQLVETIYCFEIQSVYGVQMYTFIRNKSEFMFVNNATMWNIWKWHIDIDHLP